MTYGFVYLWKDRRNQKFYLGSHWGDVDDGYVCSSPAMLEEWRDHPQDFRRKILQNVFSNREDLYEVETQWLGLIKNWDKYYNIRKSAVGQWYTWAEEKRDVVRARMSKPRHGVEWREKLKYARSADSRAKMSVSAKARTDRSHSAETRQKIGNAHIGMQRSEQAKENMRNAQLRISNQKSNRIKATFLKCPHCGKEGVGPTMRRWHFEYCRSI